MNSNEKNNIFLFANLCCNEYKKIAQQTVDILKLHIQNVTVCNYQFLFILINAMFVGKKKNENPLQLLYAKYKIKSQSLLVCL